jgi:DNA-directed RNA polymerase specialized sigma24 family protein
MRFPVESFDEIKKIVRQEIAKYVRRGIYMNTDDAEQAVYETLLDAFARRTEPVESVGPYVRVVTRNRLCNYVTGNGPSDIDGFRRKHKQLERDDNDQYLYPEALSYNPSEDLDVSIAVEQIKRICQDMVTSGKMTENQFSVCFAEVEPTSRQRRYNIFTLVTNKVKEVV